MSAVGTWYGGRCGNGVSGVFGVVETQNSVVFVSRVWNVHIKSKWKASQMIVSIWKQNVLIIVIHLVDEMPMLHEFNIIIYFNALFLFLMKQKETFFCDLKVFSECDDGNQYFAFIHICIPMQTNLTYVESGNQVQGIAWIQWGYSPSM